MVSQYAKQFNYLECKTINLVGGKVKCDCEKDLQNMASINDEFPSTKNNSNNFNNEYFLFLNVHTTGPINLFIKPTNYPFHTKCSRSQHTIDHPPQV